MNCIHKHIPNIDMVEGTTRDIIVTVLNEYGFPDDLTGYQSSFYLKSQNSSNDLVKSCEINKNEIHIHIEAKNTLGLIGVNRYEVRIYKDDDVYSVLSGTITIEKSINPFITMPKVDNM